MSSRRAAARAARTEQDPADMGTAFGLDASMEPDPDGDTHLPPRVAPHGGHDASATRRFSSAE